MLVLNRGEWFLHPSPEERRVLVKQYNERAHQGASTVLKNLNLRYFRPRNVEVTEQVASCPCARRKSRVAQKTTLRFRTLLWKPFSHLDMDLVGELPRTSHGNRWFHVVQDYPYKYVLLSPLLIRTLLPFQPYWFMMPSLSLVSRKKYNQTKVASSTIYLYEPSSKLLTLIKTCQGPTIL